jgi:hypothetical protein
VGDIPPDLEMWLDVNPRVPRKSKKEKLTGPVAKQIVRTLQEDPERFASKNQGIYLIVENIEHKKGSGGQGEVSFTMHDKGLHGLVNGGHTFRAIRQVAEERDSARQIGEEPIPPDPWDAYVRLHIMQFERPDASTIAEMAEGLNRSLQVDDPSLENLRGTFSEIKEKLDGKPGHDQISYRQGDQGDVDIQQVLTYMMMLNLNEFPDRKKHPHVYFGQPKEVLKAFIKDSDIESEDESAFRRILPHLHEVLVLTDKIQQLGVRELGRLKVSGAKKNNRVRSARNQDRTAHFAGGIIGGSFPLGWLYPVLAAFRANINPVAWREGRLEWYAPPVELLESTIEEMAQIIKQEHTDNKGKPAEVGRKEAAYRGCFSIILMELAHRGLLAQNEL